MKKSAFSVKNREELARHLEVHHRRIMTAKSCVDCSVPNSLVKHIKRRALARVRKTGSDSREWSTRTSVQGVNCDGRLQATRPIDSGTTEKAENASGSSVTGSDFASSHTPYCNYLDLDSSCLRSELYHTRTGKMAAHLQHSQKKDVSSTPPWKPAGFSSPVKCPHLDASSTSPRAKKVTGTCNKLCLQTTPPCTASCLCETIHLHDLSYPNQRAHSKKRVSFRESLLSVTSESTPSCVTPSPEATSSCVRSPSPQRMRSHTESKLLPEGIESPPPDDMPSHNASNTPSPEHTPSHIESAPSAEGTPSHSKSPFMEESVASHTENSVPSTPPRSTPSHVESQPSPEGSNKCVMAANDSSSVQLLSEIAELSRCTNGLLKQLEEAKRRVTARRKEAKYLNFVYEVTRDILSRGVLSKAALEVLFKSHVESECHELDKEALLQKIGELKLQLGIAE